MKFAHSLGFPHYSVMLRQMSMTEFQELQSYMQSESDQREDGEAEAEERRIMHHLAKVSARGVEG